MLRFDFAPPSEEENDAGFDDDRPLSPPTPQPIEPQPTLPEPIEVPETPPEVPQEIPEPEPLPPQPEEIPPSRSGVIFWGTPLYLARLARLLRALRQTANCGRSISPPAIARSSGSCNIRSARLARMVLRYPREAPATHFAGPEREAEQGRRQPAAFSQS